ncbi:demethoxyubiquinone hydroxylase family protein [Solemya pervernicosa gill symbiont]|uniref:3-demethoxyubiquinol 3-hydroxylase n=2 Tax=Gammaproteobacteria incertae sedis TaxID=118884 RepID=A0A1T2L214_9GAMM|nr:2-polyprenyl-3-methyl-6-methoxy-1,4-benzoquinone monooxygenase [Candidatus Reidiella endopervernicosa]OOZ39148.1 demethoxyubiquinone hydroxylase family protein [Solemya pervernicosa gill symbiont]QKQ28029.1 2-polyprenyl-3-methyl-6-methoxy-1,4-benzoquinone monooxygenase [Candidatus Reidiella endopervernicosa]
MNRRDYPPLDQLVMNLDMALQTVFGQPKITERPNPADDLDDTELSEAEQRHVAGLMRINHAGEVCAQALYQGQALTAKLPEVRDSMARAAQEENDHLDWCEGRVKDMGSRKSLLNPLWYAGSFAIGATAGLAGDKWSLGFVAETEKQVVKHLDEHLESIPEHDEKSRAILEQMKVDEQHHATLALQAGGADLPWPIKKLMGLTSKLMTKSVYHI